MRTLYIHTRPTARLRKVFESFIWVQACGAFCPKHVEYLSNGCTSLEPQCESHLNKMLLRESLQSLLVIIKPLNCHIFMSFISCSERHTGSVFVRLPALCSLLLPSLNFPSGIQKVHLVLSHDIDLVCVHSFIRR